MEQAQVQGTGGSVASACGMNSLHVGNGSLAGSPAMNRMEGGEAGARQAQGTPTSPTAAAGAPGLIQTAPTLVGPAGNLLGTTGRREFLLAETLVYCGVLPSTKLLVHLVHSVVLWACVAMFWILADMYVGPRACAFNLFQTSATSFDFVLGCVFRCPLHWLCCDVSNSNEMMQFRESIIEFFYPLHFSFQG